MAIFKYAFPLVDDYIYFDNSLVCVIAFFIYSYLRSYSLSNYSTKSYWEIVIHVGSRRYPCCIQIFFVAPVFASD